MAVIADIRVPLAFGLALYCHDPVEDVLTLASGEVVEVLVGNGDGVLPGAAACISATLGPYCARCTDGIVAVVFASISNSTEFRNREEGETEECKGESDGVNRRLFLWFRFSNLVIMTSPLLDGVEVLSELLSPFRILSLLGHCATTEGRTPASQPPGAR